MSDIHVLGGSGNMVRVGFHVPIPATLNIVAVDYQVAWKNAGLAVASVMTIGTGPGQIAQAESDMLTAGTLAEIVMEVSPDAVTTNPARIAMLREFWTMAQAQLMDALKGLRYFGAVFTKA